MNLFNRKTRKKHIEQFERRIAELLENDFPQFKKVIAISKVYNISFTHNPDGIYVSRGWTPKVYKEIMRSHRTFFNLSGISVAEKKSDVFTPLKLNYSYNSLTKIEIETPERFHRIYDIENVKVGQIQLEHLPTENPDRKVVEKALKSIPNDQMELLELDDTFEIEVDGKLYYTILDMEDGNYIAVDNSGNVYRLNHDHNEGIKKIANKPADFFKLYHGQKSELDQLMHE
tara:strand:+ start:102 stop:791 length:690 start_codon:yes stop_codon:yes gene_type:complete